MARKRRARKARPAREILERRARDSSGKYPIATIAYYGPNDTLATKVAVGILDAPEHVTEVERWYSEKQDIRTDPHINQEMLDFIERHGAQQVVMTDRIIGCPHEEGIDYPDGQVCPQCPFWANRDRWTGEIFNSDEQT